MQRIKYGYLFSFWTVALIVLLILCASTTAVLAFFVASKTATTNINFHGDVVLTVKTVDDTSSGFVNISNNVGTWQRKVNSETSWGTSTNAVTSLTLAGIKVKAVNNTDTWVRAMVAIKVTYVDTVVTIPTIPYNSASTTVALANYTAKENTFLTSLTNGSNIVYRYAVMKIKLTEGTDVYTKILDDYAIFTSSRGNEWQGAIVTAVILVTASSEDTTAGWTQASNDVTYSFTLT